MANGSQQNFNALQFVLRTGIGTLAGLIPGDGVLSGTGKPLAVADLIAGSHSMTAVNSQILTEAKAGTHPLKRVKGKSMPRRAGSGRKSAYFQL